MLDPATTQYGPWQTRPPQTRRSLWMWTGLSLVCLAVASVLVGRTWFGVGVTGEPAAARWWILTRAWLPLMLALWPLGTRALWASGRDFLSRLYAAVVGPVGLGLSVAVLGYLIPAPAVVMAGVLCLLNAGIYFLVWLLFWPGFERRCSSWLR